MNSGSMFERGIHFDNDQSLAGGNQTPDSSEIQLTPEDQAELESIEKEAAEMVAKMTEFAKELGFNPETIFTVERDEEIIEMAEEFNEAQSQNKQKNLENQEHAEPSEIAFLQTDLQNPNSQDILDATQTSGPISSYDPNFPDFGMAGIRKELGSGRSFYLNSAGQLIHFGQSNYWPVARMYGTPTILFTKKDETALHASQDFLDREEGDLIELQARIHDILAKLGKVEEYIPDPRENETRIKMEKARSYRSLITRENTFSFAPEVERASRDLMRLVANIAVKLSQRAAYVCQKAGQDEGRFRAINIDEIADRNIRSEDMLNLRRSFFSYEKVKNLYLIDSSYEFTEGDATAAEEANLPWSKIEQEKNAE
jgi:hypothetical protein